MSTKTQILAIASTVAVLSLLAIGPILSSNSVFATSDNDNHDHHDNDRHHDCNRDKSLFTSLMILLVTTAFSSISNANNNYFI